MNPARNLILIIRGGDLYVDSYSSPTKYIADSFKSMGYGTKVCSIYDQLLIDDEMAKRFALIYSLSPIQIERWRTTSGKHLSELCPFVCHYPNSPFLIDSHIRSAPDSIIFASSSIEYLYQFKHFFRKRNVIMNCPAFPTSRDIEPVKDRFLNRKNLFLFAGAVSLHDQTPHRNDEELQEHWTEQFGALAKPMFDCYKFLLFSEFTSTVETLDNHINIDKVREADPNLIVRMVRELDIRVRFAKRRSLIMEVVRFPSLIVGAGWDSFLEDKGRATVTGADIAYSSLPDLYRDSQVTLSVAHSTVYGEHERIYLAWLCGATLASERNLWLEREFREGVDYLAVPPGGPDCADALADLARDEEKRFRIAHSGWERAKGRFLPEHSAAYYLRIGSALFAQQAISGSIGTRS